MTDAAAFLTAFRNHLGEPAPINTCMITVARVLREVGLPLDGAHTDGRGRADQNVSDFHDLAARGIDGYRLIPTAQAVPGDLLLWPQDSHVTVFEHVIAGGLVVSIGGGGPSGRVARQPTGGGGNAREYFPIAVRPPFTAPAPAPAPAPVIVPAVVVAPVLVASFPAQTSTENDGVPGAVFWQRLAIACARDRSLGSGERAVSRIASRFVNAQYGGLDSTAASDGIDGPTAWNLYARYSNDHYGTRLTINGKNGPATQRARYRIAAHVLNGLRP